MRPYRGKRKDNEGWVEGNLITHITEEGKGVLHTFIEEIPSHWNTKHDSHFWEHRRYSVIPESVGQEVGGYDEDGKMIHEGDICQFSDWKPKEIIWSDGRYWLGDTLVICCEMECANMKIIGNKKQTTPNY